MKQSPLRQSDIELLYESRVNVLKSYCKLNAWGIVHGNIFAKEIGLEC